MVSVYRAFFHVFTHAPQYDDTGFMLSLIQGFNEHGGLYRETFSRYGPFFSEFYFVIGKLLRVPITQDGIRWVVVILWTLSSVVGGLVAYRLANKIWIALLTQAFSFHELYTLEYEPGHPISLVALLLVALALALCIARSRHLAQGRRTSRSTVPKVKCALDPKRGWMYQTASGTAMRSQCSSCCAAIPGRFGLPGRSPSRLGE